MKTIVVTFKEIGFNSKEWHASELGAVAVDMACDYIMDKFYPEFNECDVIKQHRDIEVDIFNDWVTIPVAKVYKPEYIN